MASGYRDIIAWLFGWLSAHKSWQTDGPYRIEASQMFATGSTAGGAFHCGAAAAVVSAGNVTAGECHG